MFNLGSAGAFNNEKKKIAEINKRIGEEEFIVCFSFVLEFRSRSSFIGAKSFFGSSAKNNQSSFFALRYRNKSFLSFQSVLFVLLVSWIVGLSSREQVLLIHVSIPNLGKIHLFNANQTIHMIKNNRIDFIFLSSYS